MKTLIVIMMVAMLGFYSSGRKPGAATPDAVRAIDVSEVGGSGLPPGAADRASAFATIDITINSLGQPMGAYQFELTAADAPFVVVGVESGGHPAFDHGRPPYFDRTAEQHGTDRLIVAAYALPNLDEDALPTRSVRVATVHVMFAQPIDADALPAIELNLVAVGNAQGEPIDARINFDLNTPKRPE